MVQPNAAEGMCSGTVEFICPSSVQELEATRQILLEYAQSLNTDLCFQDFDQELAQLPGCYASPGGLILLAMADGKVAGCCALRPLQAQGHANACEMKRLYVRSAFRGTGLGRQLVLRVMQAAREKAYSCILLDTLSHMQAASALYQELGFIEIAPYYHNPLAGVRYLKAVL